MSDEEAHTSKPGLSERTVSGSDYEDPGQASWRPPGVDDGISGAAVGNVGEPLPVPEESSPLEEDEPEGVIPPCPLWVMKDRRHVQWSEIVGFPPERIRERLGQGDETVYVIEDGHQHVMLGRNVGAVSGGSQYGLVGRASKAVFDGLRSGELQPRDAFEEAEEVALCGVDIDEHDKASEIFVVQFYGSASSVPSEYLPGNPTIDLAEPLPIGKL